MELFARLLLLLAVRSSAAWITVSQSRYGATIEHIHSESLGLDVGRPQKSLGHLWAMPRTTDDQTGLGCLRGNGQACCYEHDAENDLWPRRQINKNIGQQRKDTERDHGQESQSRGENFVCQSLQQALARRCLVDELGPCSWDDCSALHHSDCSSNRTNPWLHRRYGSPVCLA